MWCYRGHPFIGWLVRRHGRQQTQTSHLDGDFHTHPLDTALAEIEKHHTQEDMNESLHGDAACIVHVNTLLQEFSDPY